MKKRVYILVLAAYLLAYNAAAAENEAPVVTAALPAPASTYTFSVEQAKTYALENHPAVKLAEANVNQSNYATKEAQALYIENKYHNKLTNANGLYDSFDAFKVRQGMYYQQALAGYNTAVASLSQIKGNIGFGVESAYFKYLNAQQKVEITQTAYDTAATKKTQVDEQLAQGMSSELEQFVADNTLKKSESDLYKAKRELETAFKELKAAVGLPLDSIVTLTTQSIDMPKLPTITLQDAVNMAKVNSLEVIGAKEQLAVAQNTFDITNKWYGKNTYPYSQAEYGLSSANETYSNALNKAELNVHKAFDTVLTVLDSVEIMKSNIKLSEMKYDIDKQKYDLGMIAKMELDDSWYSLQSMKMQNADLQYSCYASIRQFELSYQQ